MVIVFVGLRSKPMETAVAIESVGQMNGVMEAEDLEEESDGDEVDIEEEEEEEGDEDSEEMEDGEGDEEEEVRWQVTPIERFPPTWLSDCADWPGYPGQSRAPCAHAIIMCLNHEWRSSWRHLYTQ